MYANELEYGDKKNIKRCKFYFAPLIYELFKYIVICYFFNSFNASSILYPLRF